MAKKPTPSPELINKALDASIDALYALRKAEDHGLSTKWSRRAIKTLERFCDSTGKIYPTRPWPAPPPAEDEQPDPTIVGPPNEIVLSDGWCWNRKKRQKEVDELNRNNIENWRARQRKNLYYRKS